MVNFDPKQFQDLIVKAQQQAQDLQAQMQKTIVEASSAIIRFGKFVALDHGTHGAVEDDNALAE